MTESGRRRIFKCSECGEIFFDQNALLLIKMTAMVVVGIPCFFSDGYSCYMQALIECYHKIKTFSKTGKKGRPKNPVKEPHPDLVHGQVVKERRQVRIVKITHRVKCGAIRLAQLGLKISTSLLERLNLTFSQSLAPLVRKTLCFSKERNNLEKQTLFFQTFYNFARPHMSLRERNSEETHPFEQTWKQKTPAMAADITNRVWTFRELLTVKLAHAP